EQITEDGDVALRRRAYVLGHELWIRRIGDIPDDDAVVVTLNDVVVLERQIGIDPTHERLGGRNAGQLAQIPDRFLRVKESGRKADTRIRWSGRLGRVDGYRGRRGGIFGYGCRLLGRFRNGPGRAGGDQQQTADQG